MFLPIGLCPLASEPIMPIVPDAAPPNWTTAGHGSLHPLPCPDEPHPARRDPSPSTPTLSTNVGRPNRVVNWKPGHYCRRFVSGLRVDAFDADRGIDRGGHTAPATGGVLMGWCVGRFYGPSSGVDLGTSRHGVGERRTRGQFLRPAPAIVASVRLHCDRSGLSRGGLAGSTSCVADTGFR
jgi:hypothetical protein